VLLRDPGDPPMSTQEINQIVRRITMRRRRSPDVGVLIARARDRVAGTPERRQRTMRIASLVGPSVLVVAGLSAWLALRPVPKPDYTRAAINTLFNYTLLTDEFNRLPVEERMRLMGQLVERLKGMSAGDSALLGAFAAGIAGSARKQIEENVSRLAIDVWDKYAVDYQDVPAQDRDAFLDHTFIEFAKMMETTAGEVRTISDADRLAEVRRQADRDREALKSGKGVPPARAMSRVFTFMHDNVGSHASAAQKARGQAMMVDMMRHFRGQDIETGKNR
jgi:hypothetical protein